MLRCRFGVSLLLDFDQPVQAVSDIQKCKCATSNKGGYQKRSDTPDDGKQKTAREAPDHNADCRRKIHAEETEPHSKILMIAVLMSMMPSHY